MTTHEHSEPMPCQPDSEHVTLDAEAPFDIQEADIVPALAAAEMAHLPRRARAPPQAVADVMEQALGAYLGTQLESTSTIGPATFGTNGLGAREARGIISMALRRWPSVRADVAIEPVEAEVYSWQQSKKGERS